MHTSLGLGQHTGLAPGVRWHALYLQQTVWRAERGPNVLHRSPCLQHLSPQQL
jgi:hypothetical protein